MLFDQYQTDHSAKEEMKLENEAFHEETLEERFLALDQRAQQLEEQYKLRDLPEGARVTRYAPSPTGFMHLGNLFSAFISERTAHTTNGVFYVRIEDTDKKREVEGGVTAILNDLASFGFTVDEGAAGETEEKGNYGPYRQSMRKDISFS